MTLFLVQNGVLSARESAQSAALSAVAGNGVAVLADEFSLRERVELMPEEDALEVSDVIEVADVIEAPQAEDEFVVVDERPELTEPETPELEVDLNAKDELFGSDGSDLSEEEPGGPETKG